MDSGGYRHNGRGYALSTAFVPDPLTVSGMTAANKVYDGTTSATLNTSNASLKGMLPGDAGNVTLVTSSATGTFDDANVGTGKTVSISGLTLSGSAAGNYSLTQPVAIASITMPAVPLALPVPILIDGNLSLTIDTVRGPKYILEFAPRLSDLSWTQIDAVLGNGGRKTLSDLSVTSSVRFYRVRIECSRSLVAGPLFRPRLVGVVIALGAALTHAAQAMAMNLTPEVTCSIDPQSGRAA